MLLLLSVADATCNIGGAGGAFDVAANEVPKTAEEVQTILAIVKVRLG